MKARLDRIPPLTGSPTERCEEIRNYINNRLLPELERAFSEQEKAVEKVKQEVKKDG